jgi:hypothetical protein
MHTEIQCGKGKITCSRPSARLKVNVREAGQRAEMLSKGREVDAELEGFSFVDIQTLPAGHY